MNADRAFIDTNVFIYYQQSDNLEKHKISFAAINFFDCVISTQVLNEICNIMTRKFPTPLADIQKYITDIIQCSDLVIVDDSIVLKALNYHFKFSISYYDALMVAAAMEANCKYLISEDMQDGLIIENKLQILNIYNHADLLI
jgi:predicted nucleic acid-binding protein